MHLDSGVTLQVEADAQEPYASFNLAADRIEKRLRRYRRRLRDHHAGGTADPRVDDGLTEVHSETLSETLSTGPVVVAETLASLKELSVSGAVMELDQTNAHFLIFRHTRDGHANLVYRRKDGNIGWIDSLAAAKAAAKNSAP